MQAPQRCGLRVLRPEDERTATACPQNLLSRPKSICGLLRSHPQHLVNGKSDVAESEPIRGMRRLQERNRPTARTTERRAQESQFTDSGLLDHQVDKGSDRPATAGKLGRQRGIPSLNHPATATRELGRTPQGRMYLFGRNGSAGHVESKNLYIYTVSYTQIRRCELSLFSKERGRATCIARPHVLLSLLKGGPT